MDFGEVTVESLVMVTGPVQGAEFTQLLGTHFAAATDIPHMACTRRALQRLGGTLAWECAGLWLYLEGKSHGENESIARQLDRERKNTALLKAQIPQKRGGTALLQRGVCSSQGLTGLMFSSSLLHLELKGKKEKKMPLGSRAKTNRTSDSSESPVQHTHPGSNKVVITNNKERQLLHGTTIKVSAPASDTVEAEKTTRTATGLAQSQAVGLWGC